MKTYQQIEAVLTGCAYPGLTFELSPVGAELWLRVRCGEWNGRKWHLSVHMTDGEIVQTAFLAVRTAIEHEMREQFQYLGVAVFGPHIEIAALWKAACHTEVRE